MRISKDIGLGWLGLALCAPLVLFGCGRYRARATVTATPRMAYVQPGVWVVANQPDAVFYANGAYWRYDGGVWYQSTYLGGWAPAPLSVVPHAVVRIDRPRRYRGYRLPRGARIRPAPRAHVAPRGPAVRVRAAADATWITASGAEIGGDTVTTTDAAGWAACTAAARGSVTVRPR